MAGERHGVALWPGAVSVKSCTYTMGVGVSPGTAVLTILPQSAPIAASGDLVITDGVGTVVLRDCKVTRFSEKRDASGVVWQIGLMDRRWRWRDCGGVSIWCNQMDPHGKFIPWTVASPTEVAEYCLDAMYERRFQIDLPTGLTTASAAGVKEFLPTGVNFPPTGVNPPLNWDTVKPMVALEGLADTFGRVVAWRWQEDAIWVAQRGAGGPLPPGSISSRCPGVTSPDTPDGVVVVGAPTRYQVDFELQGMAEEWDGRLVPRDEVSYAPLEAGAFHEVKVSGVWSAEWRYYVEVQLDPDKQPATFFVEGSAVANAAAIYTAMAAAVNADPVLNKVLTATAVAAKLTLKANAMGPNFDVKAYTHAGTAVPPARGPLWRSEVVAKGANGRTGWSRCYPPNFVGVRATPRLTLAQARDLAAKSVWKYYQLTGRDISKKGKILVPGYGRVDRYRIQLLDEQCEQVVPEGPDFAIRMRDGTPVVQNMYNGFSRAKPAACFGSVAKRTAGHLFYVLDKSKGINTSEDEQVQVPFSVDSTYFTIKFSQPVYRIGPGFTFVEPTLRLRTACNVRDATTGAFDAYLYRVSFAGSAGLNYAFQRNDDVQVNVIPTYGNGGRVVRVNTLEADPILRAGYYAQGMQLKYLPKASLVNVYNGIVPIQLDGAVTQITWEVGDGGATTTASLNFEHNTSVPPYPQRRRDEMLRAAVGPGGFLGQIGNRQAHQPVPFQKPGG